MPFNNYKTANNATGTPIGALSAGSTTLILTTGQGARFPSVYPYLLTIEERQSVSPFAVTKREIVKVTLRVGDTLTIVRSAGTCLPDDSSNTPGTTAFSFNTPAQTSVNLAVNSETTDDMQVEIARLEAEKLNKAGDTLTGLLQGAKSTNIASATTTNLATATGNLVHITGTTTITSFGTLTAGTQMTIVFDGILTLTHNATSLILPGGANITTAVGDSAIFESEGSGNWKCVSYTKANGQAVAGGMDITGLSAVTTLADADETVFYISGTGNRKITKPNLKNTLFPFIGAKAIQTAVQSINNNTATLFNFGGEEFDTDTMHDNVTNNPRLTIKTAGYFHVVASIQGTTMGTTADSYVRIYKNGTTLIGQNSIKINSGVNGIIADTFVNLAVNDYLTVEVQLALPANPSNVGTGDNKTFFYAIKQG